MAKNGISLLPLSHTLRMENNLKRSNGVTLSQKEAEEYCAYKRQKKITEITSAMRQTEGVLTANDGAMQTCERATRLRQIAVRMTPTDLSLRGEAFEKGGVKIDCLIGGNGETLSKVKAYEAKKAIRMGAKELTLMLTPSLISGNRFAELRKEIRLLQRAAKKNTLKVRVEGGYAEGAISRVVRLCGEMGVGYFSVPYYAGCERLAAELTGGCQLEVSGVETLPILQKMMGAGVGRIVTSRAWELYAEWLKEADKITLEEKELPAVAEKEKEEKSSSQKTPKKEEDYRCRLEGNTLKFS